jgi:1-acyl-sn-glycerol-3-phosphate acyltransferase
MGSALRTYYRRIEVTGVEHLDGARPTILASNHPNSIIDPLMVGLFESRRVSFCARDGLFRVPVFGSLLRSVGAIPIARRSDHGDKADNSAAFEACRQTLLGGGAISLFPEGHTHSALRVDDLRTGTARIALDASRASGYAAGVVIVPIGLNFLVRQAFRSDVHVAFGAPIAVADYAELDREDPCAAARALTDALTEAIRTLTVHIVEEDDERLIAQTTAIIAGIRSEHGLDVGGQTPSERTALVQRIVHAYHWYQDVNPSRFADLRERMAWFVEERRRLGLGGETAVLQHRSETLVWGEERSLTDKLWRWALGAPFALVGLVVAGVPYLLLRGLVTVLRPDLVRMAWFKLLVGAAVFGVSWTVMGTVVARSWGLGPAVAFAVLAMPLSLYTLRYLTELRLHRVGLAAMLRRFREADRLSAIRAERDALSQDLREVRDHYLAVHGEQA